MLYVVMHNIKVDTEICEQCFSWLSRYVTMTRMSRTTFVFLLLYLCDLHNEREENTKAKWLYDVTVNFMYVTD